MPMCYSLTGKDFIQQQERIRLEENPRSSGRTPIDRFRVSRVCRTLAKLCSELAHSCSLLHRKECELTDLGALNAVSQSSMGFFRIVKLLRGGRFPV